MKTTIPTILFCLAVSSCSNEQCGDFGNSQYDIISMNATSTTTAQPIENFGFPFSTTETASTESIEINQFVLQLSSATGPAFANNSKAKKPKFNLSIIPTAHACSPIPPFTSEIIDTISVTSSSDYSNDFLAGTNLAPLFLVIYNDAHVYNNSGTETTAYTLEEFVASSPSAGKLLQLSLSQPPSISNDHQFNIEYSHTDGEHFMMSLPELTFQ